MKITEKDRENMSPGEQVADNIKKKMIRMDLSSRRLAELVCKCRLQSGDAKKQNMKIIVYDKEIKAYETKLSRLLSGKYQSLSFEDLRLIAKVLNTSVEYIVTGNEIKNIDAAERTGLSNESIEQLSTCSDRIIGLLMGYSKVPKMIDMLLQDPDLRFLRILYSYIVDDFSTIPHIKVQTIKYKQTERGFEKVPDDYIGEVTEEREKVLDPIPMDQFPDLTREVIIKGASMKIMDYVQQLRSNYQDQHSKKDPDAGLNE